MVETPWKTGGPTFTMSQIDFQNGDRYAFFPFLSGRGDRSYARSTCGSDPTLKPRRDLALRVKLQYRVHRCANAGQSGPDADPSGLHRLCPDQPRHLRARLWSLAAVPARRQCKRLSVSLSDAAPGWQPRDVLNLRAPHGESKLSELSFPTSPDRRHRRNTLPTAAIAPRSHATHPPASLAPNPAQVCSSVSVGQAVPFHICA